MSRTYRLYLNDIVAAVERIEADTQDIHSQEQLSEATTVLYAVMMNLLIVGEAVKSLPAEVRQYAPDVPWQSIARFRDRLVHRYWTLEMNYIWLIVRRDLPALKARISDILAQLPPDELPPDAD